MKVIKKDLDLNGPQEDIYTMESLNRIKGMGLDLWEKVITALYWVIGEMASMHSMVYKRTIHIDEMWLN